MQDPPSPPLPPGVRVQQKRAGDDRVNGILLLQKKWCDRFLTISALPYQPRPFFDEHEPRGGVSCTPPMKNWKNAVLVNSF